MSMIEKIREILPEALLASMADGQANIGHDSDRATITGQADLNVLAARIARLAGIEDIVMIPVLDMKTWTPDSKPEKFMPFPADLFGREFTPAPARSGQAVLKLVKQPQEKTPLRLVRTSEGNPTPAA